MLPHPQSTRAGRGGPRTSELSIKSRRRNHFTSVPLIILKSKLGGLGVNKLYGVSQKGGGYVRYILHSHPTSIPVDALISH